VLPVTQLVVFASSTYSDKLLISIRCTDEHLIRNRNERERLVTASHVMTKELGLQLGKRNKPESGLVL
jgi:hypothetical protein